MAAYNKLVTITPFNEGAMCRVVAPPCLALLLANLFAPLASAEILPTFSIRYLTIRADVIVIGEPIAFDGKTLPLKYRVVKVLKGPEKLAEKEIGLVDTGVYQFSPPFGLRGEEPGKPPVTITRAVLFLENPQAGSALYRPVLSGIRALTADGDLLVPRQFINPGPQHFVKRPGPEWDAMLGRIESDLPMIAEIRELKTVDNPAKRNQAILEWIARNKEEFGGNYLKEESKGLASLELEIFQWVLESYRPEDCWRAVELSVDVGVGVKTSPSFCTPDGRNLLLEKLSDEQLSSELRLKALNALGDGGNLWYAGARSSGQTQVITNEEQRTILDRVMPLADHADPNWRTAAVRCLMNASCSYDASFSDRKSKHAVPLLIKLYKTEKDYSVRMQVVEALHTIESEEAWQKLTGNPQGMVVTVRLSGRQNDRLQFQLSLDHTRATISEVPSFRFEKVGENGNVARTRVIQPRPIYPKDVFSKGWSPFQGMIELYVPANDIEPGSWRVTVEGRLNADKWRSEPIEIKLP